MAWNQPCSPTTQRSQASASPNPAPMAAPCTAATSGMGAVEDPHRLFVEAGRPVASKPPWVGGVGSIAGPEVGTGAERSPFRAHDRGAGAAGQIGNGIGHGAQHRFGEQVVRAAVAG